MFFLNFSTNLTLRSVILWQKEEGRSKKEDIEVLIPLAPLNKGGKGGVKVNPYSPYQRGFRGIET